MFKKLVGISTFTITRLRVLTRAYYVVAGDILLNGLKELGKKYPAHMQNVRGRGTFCAFDCPSMEKRDAMVEMLKTEG